MIPLFGWMPGPLELVIVAVIVLGDPAYYTRFGFCAALTKRLQAPWAGPHLMAIELEPGSLGDEAGIARYAPAFMALDR